MTRWLDTHKTSDGKDVHYFNGDGYVSRRDYEALQEELAELRRKNERK